MERVFIDVNIAMYAAGTPHSLREPCQRVILAAGGGQIDAWTDVEVFQEILYRYLHIQEKGKGLQVLRSLPPLDAGQDPPCKRRGCGVSAPVGDSYPSKPARNTDPLAVMNHHNINRIITSDKGFAAIPDVAWLDPLTF